MFSEPQNSRSYRWSYMVPIIWIQSYNCPYMYQKGLRRPTSISRWLQSILDESAGITTQHDQTTLNGVFSSFFRIGMSMALSKWAMTPIYVGWIRPVNRWKKHQLITNYLLPYFWGLCFASILATLKKRLYKPPFLAKSCWTFMRWNLPLINNSMEMPYCFIGRKVVSHIFLGFKHLLMEPVSIWLDLRILFSNGWWKTTS